MVYFIPTLPHLTLQLKNKIFHENRITIPRIKMKKINQTELLAHTGNCFDFQRIMHYRSDDIIGLKFYQ